MKKEEALQEMIDGNKICHEYYSSDEFIYMKGNLIYDENNYHMGSVNCEFWSKIQKWTDGWKIYKS